MDLDAQLGESVQRAVDNQALVEKAGGRLDNIRLEAADHAHRIVRGVDGDTDPGEEALVAQGEKPRPEVLAMGTQKVAGDLHNDGVRALEAQSAQRGARLGLHVLGAAINTAGLDHDPERAGRRQAVTDHLLAIWRRGCGVQHPHARARGDGKNLTDLGLRRAAASRRPRVEWKLGGAQAEL